MLVQLFTAHAQPTPSNVSNAGGLLLLGAPAHELAAVLRVQDLDHVAVGILNESNALRRIQHVLNYLSIFDNAAVGIFNESNDLRDVVNVIASMYCFHCKSSALNI